MLHRPSKAVMAPIAEAVGTLAGTLTQPFISRDVGYVQDDPGQKSRKVRNHMLKSPFKSVIARTATFALVLSLAIAFATVGLAPSASAQQADGPSCEANGSGKEITCSYDENGTDPVADFTAMDPEGQGVDWGLYGADAGKFTIDGGVLAFKKSPSHESKSSYEVNVRATEMLGADDIGPAKYSELVVTVNINDLDEPGKVTFDYKQPQAGAEWVASFTDPDDESDSSVSYSWSVPKVSRPSISNDQHWINGEGTGQATNTYTPVMSVEDVSTTPEDETETGEENKILRVKVTYSDVHGDDKAVYARTIVPVRTQPESNDIPTFTGANPNRNVNENAKVGQHVGNPVTATEDEDLNLLTYSLADATPNDAEDDLFKIDAKTGQITVAAALAADETGDTTTTHTVSVMARDPFGERDGEDQILNGISAAFEVTITVKEVNEAPSVVQVDSQDDAVAADMVVTEVDIMENHPLKPIPEDTNTPDVIEAMAANVIMNFYDAADQDLDDATPDQDTADAGQVKLMLSGDDMDDFELVEAVNDEDPPVGQSRYELRFKNAKPNFEAPMDANKDNMYKVTVVAEDLAGLTGKMSLVIMVGNMAEDGSVELSSNQPAVGRPVTATLKDPDTGQTGLKWQWFSSSDGTNFVIIQGATSATYTPKGAVEDVPATTNIDESDPGDEGRFLKARVTYTDDGMADDAATMNVDESIQMAEEDSPNAVRLEPEVNSDPVFDAGITREVAENSETDETVGGPVTASDPDEDTLTYSISGGADMSAFTIDRGTGQIKVGKGTKLNYEGDQTSYMVEVTATDPFGGMASAMVTIMVTNMNEPPMLMGDMPCETSSDGMMVTCSYDENGMDDVATFTATDPEGQGVEWDLNGANASAFTIDGGVLAFKKSPSYEAATSYEVTVRATEMLGATDTGPAMSTEVMVTVNINDLDEPGKVTFDYKQPQAGATWKASFSDPDAESTDAVSWLWSVPKVSRPAIDNDQHWANAVGANGTMDTYTPLMSVEEDTADNVDGVDGEEGKILRVKVSYSDVHGDEKVVYARTTVAVREAPDSNADPEFADAVAERSVNENAKKGQHVGNPVTATVDEDLSLLTYALTDDATGLFSIDPKTGQIMLAMATLDADAADATTTYTVQVTARDPFGAREGADSDLDGVSEPFAVTITVKEVNEAPTVGQYNETDSDDVAADDEVTRIEVGENYPLEDIEADADATPPVVAMDASVITVVDGADTDVYSFVAQDQDVDDGEDAQGDPSANASLVELMLSGDDAARFELVEHMTDADPPVGEGRYELRFKAMPNFEAPADTNKDNRYLVNVVAEDQAGLTGMKALVIRVENVNEDGTVKLSTDQPAVGFPITATLNDPDTGQANLKWQWKSSSDGTNYLNIFGATSDTYTPKAAVEDDESTTNIDETDPGDEGRFLLAMVTYRDDGMKDDPATDDDESVQMADADSLNAVRIEPDVNADPVFDAGITREVAENTEPGETVGGPVTASDPDGDSLTYSLSGGADMGSFTIDSDGQIKVGKGTKLNFESSQTTYMVEVTATDPFGGSGSTMVTIMVTDMNEGPTLSLGPGSIIAPTPGVVGGYAAVSYRENGTGAVGTYTTTIASPTWSLSGADAGDFTISGGVLSFNSSPDYEAPTDANTDNVYMVTVMADNGNGGAELDVTVTVTDMDEEAPPTNGNGAFDPLSYDADSSGTIEKSEMISAINDYVFDGTIEKSEMIQVINLYLFGS